MLYLYVMVNKQLNTNSMVSDKQFKDKIFDIIKNSFGYAATRLGKRAQRELIPDVDDKMKPIVERLISLLDNANQRVVDLGPRPNGILTLGLSEWMRLSSKEQEFLNKERLKYASAELLVSNLKNLLFWVLMEIRFSDDFRESNKEIIKHVIHTMDHFIDDSELLNNSNQWFHYSTPVATAMYFADSIPSVRNFMAKFRKR